VQGVLGLRIDELTQFIFGFVQTGRVHKNNLGFVSGEDGQLTLAGCLRLGGDARHRLPKQAVGECALAGVGLANNGDKAGLVSGG